MLREKNPAQTQYIDSKYNDPFLNQVFYIFSISSPVLLLCNQGGKHSVMTTCIVWLPNGRVLASSARGPGFNPQSRTASYQRN